MRIHHASVPRPLLAVLAVVLGLALLPGPAAAVEDVAPARVEGVNRVDTAAEIAMQAHPDGTPQAVIATAVAPQDALTGAALAGALDAALLLVYPNELPPRTTEALDALGVTDIAIVGGQSSVSEAVAIGLADDGRRSTTRIAGQSQYDTAQLVSQAVFTFAGLPTIDGRTTALLANGEGFADALAGSPVAFAGPTPVLYTEQDVLRAEAAAFIDEVDVEQVIILGGPVAISADVEAAVEARGPEVVRLGGATRVETSTIVAEWASDRLAFGLDDIMLARGDDFPDAMTAGQLAGVARRPLVVAANPTALSQEGRAFFARNCGTIEVVQAVGGQAAVSTPVLEDAETAAESCAAGGDPSLGDDALPDFAVDPVPVLETGISQLDTIAVTQLGGLTSLDVALVDCEAITIDDDGSAVFDDDDADGAADGLASSTTGVAVITGINNGNVEDTQLVRGATPEGDRLGVQVSAGAEDCAGLVVWEPRGEGLPVDSSGRPTTAYGATAIVFDDGQADDPEPTPADTLVYRVLPQEPVEGTPAEPEELTVDGRYDDQPISRDLDVILFPCAGTEVLGSGPDSFADTDADGGADGFGGTDTGAMVITGINGAPITPTTVVGGVEAIDDQILVEVTADTDDCAVVAIVAGDGNGQLDVDADGVPVEDYGVGVVRYQ